MMRKRVALLILIAIFSSCAIPPRDPSSKVVSVPTDENDAAYVLRVLAGQAGTHVHLNEVKGLVRGRGRMTLRDALTDVCRQAGCQFHIFPGRPPTIVVYIEGSNRPNPVAQ